MSSQASRLLWLATPDFSGFLAWHPGSTLAHHVVPGEEEAKGRRLPGRAVDIQSPAAGLGTGAAGLFLQPNGGTAAALLAEAEQPWKPLDAQAPRALSLSPNGRRLALATGEKQLLRFALPTGRLAETLNADDIERVDRVFIGDAGGIWALGNRGSLGALARNDRVTVLDLGLRVESAGVPARGHRLFAAGDDQNVLLTVSARPDNGVDRLISRPIELPHTAQGLHALAHSPDGLHVAVLHPEENSLSFVSGRTLRRTVTLPLDFLGGDAFTGGGKLPAAAASPGGEHWAFASELGIIVLESGSVVP